MVVPDDIDPEMASSEEVNRYKLIAVVDSSRTISDNEVSFKSLGDFVVFEKGFRNLNCEFFAAKI